MNRSINIIQDWLYPPRCLLCGDPGTHNRDICSSCLASLPYNNLACQRCGVVIAISSTASYLCGECQKQAPPFDTTQAIFRYQDTIRYLIQALKYQASYPCARLFAALMTEKLKGLRIRPELIIPVPLHPIRYHKRGFNQAIEIARPISHTLNIPIDVNCCARIRATTPQSELAANQRKINLKNAFNVTRPMSVNHVVIIDDIVTTGATVSELAKVLRKAGVKRIDVWACARA